MGICGAVLRDCFGGEIASSQKPFLAMTGEVVFFIRLGRMEDHHSAGEEVVWGGVFLIVWSKS